MRNTSRIGKEWKVVLGNYVYRGLTSYKSRWSTTLQVSEHRGQREAEKDAAEWNEKLERLKKIERLKGGD